METDQTDDKNKPTTIRLGAGDDQLCWNPEIGVLNVTARDTNGEAVTVAILRESLPDVLLFIAQLIGADVDLPADGSRSQLAADRRFASAVMSGRFTVVETNGPVVTTDRFEALSARFTVVETNVQQQRERVERELEGAKQTLGEIKRGVSAALDEMTSSIAAAKAARRDEVSDQGLFAAISTQLESTFATKAYVDDAFRRHKNALHQAIKQAVDEAARRLSRPPGLLTRLANALTAPAGSPPRAPGATSPEQAAQAGAAAARGRNGAP